MLRGLASYARRYFRALFAASEEERLLVIDDAHELRGALDEIFAILAEELPPHATLLISSRDPIPEALARAVVSGNALEIGAEALRLDLSEALDWSQAWRLELAEAESSGSGERPRAGPRDSRCVFASRELWKPGAYPLQ